MKSDAFNGQESRLKKIILWLVVVWFVVCIIRVGYGWVRMVTEEKSLFSMSEIEKKRIYFGKMFRVIEFVQLNTERDAKIILISDDVYNYYLSKYELYPRIILAKRNIDEIESHQYCLYDYFVEEGKMRLESKLLQECNFKKIAESRVLNTIIYKKDG